MRWNSRKTVQIVIVLFLPLRYIVTQLLETSPIVLFQWAIECKTTYFIIWHILTWGACERSVGWCDIGSSCILACCRWRRTACRPQIILAGCGFYVFTRDIVHPCLMRGWKTAGELGGYRKGTSYQLALNWEDAATNCVIDTLKEFTRDYLKRADGGFHVELRSGTWSVVVNELSAGELVRWIVLIMSRSAGHGSEEFKTLKRSNARSF